MDMTDFAMKSGHWFVLETNEYCHRDTSLGVMTEHTISRRLCIEDRLKYRKTLGKKFGESWSAPMYVWYTNLFCIGLSFYVCR